MITAPMFREMGMGLIKVFEILLLPFTLLSQDSRVNMLKELIVLMVELILLTSFVKVAVVMKHETTETSHNVREPACSYGATLKDRTVQSDFTMQLVGILSPV